MSDSKDRMQIASMSDTRILLANECGYQKTDYETKNISGTRIRIYGDQNGRRDGP